MTTYNGLKPNYVKLTLPLKEIEQATKDIISKVSINVPDVTVGVEPTSTGELRIGINIDFDSIPDLDVQEIHERTGLREDGAFDNGDYVLKRIFHNVQEPQSIDIVASEIDTEVDPDAPYVLVEIPFDSYAELALV